MFCFSFATFKSGAVTINLAGILRVPSRLLEMAFSLVERFVTANSFSLREIF